jgi:hypothetical protein
VNDLLPILAVVAVIFASAAVMVVRLTAQSERHQGQFSHHTYDEEPESDA